MSENPIATLRPRHVAPVLLRTLIDSEVDASLAVTGVTADSRLVRPGDLYVGLPGARVHGASFAAAAVRAGAVALLTDAAGRELVAEQAEELTDALDVPVLAVRDPRARLADLAVQIYGAPASRLRMLGLTGTNGKTTTSYLAEAALHAAGFSTGVIGTLGFTLDGRAMPGVRTTITTPEAPELQALLAAMAEGHPADRADRTGDVDPPRSGADAVVMEVSSHALALGRTDGIVFDVAAFTNLGSDHLDFHHDLESYFEAKALLFTPAHTRHAVLNVDDERGRQLAERALATGLRVTTVSLHGPADYTLAVPTEAADAATINAATINAATINAATAGAEAGADHTVLTPTGPVRLRVPIPGDYNLRNALTALALAVSVGADPQRAADGIATTVVPGRMQPVPLGPGAPSVVVDFAHTPQAVAAALEALRGRRRIVVLGSGGDRDPGKRGPMGAAATAAELVVVTDDNPRHEDPAAIRASVLRGARQAAGPATTVVDGGERRTAIRLALAEAGPGDVVAVLGKGHETGQEIDGEIHPFDDVDVVVQEWASLADGGRR